MDELSGVLAGFSRRLNNILNGSKNVKFRNEREEVILNMRYSYTRNLCIFSPFTSVSCISYGRLSNRMEIEGNERKFL